MTKTLRKGVLTTHQLKKLYALGYLSTKGKRVARQELKRRNNGTRTIPE